MEVGGRSGRRKRNEQVGAMAGIDQQMLTAEGPVENTMPWTGQTKGARYTAETQYSGRFAMEVKTRPHGRSHGGVMVRCRSRR